MAYQSYSSYAAKPPPPKAAQKLPKQRDIAEYASFEVRGLHVRSHTLPLLIVQIQPFTWKDTDSNGNFRRSRTTHNQRESHKVIDSLSRPWHSHRLDWY